MTTAARCLTIDQALFTRSLLEGCGLRAYIPDELTAQTDPVIFTPKAVRVEFHRRAHLPIVLASGLCKRAVAVPWWNGRRLELTTYSGR